MIRDSLLAKYADGENTLGCDDKPPCWAVSSGQHGEFRL